MLPTISPERGRLTIQELAKASGVSVATLKFYLREKLLAPGDPSRPHRAYYDATHVRRVRVIRALREVGGLSIDVMRRALGALETPGADSIDAIAPAIDALAPLPDAPGVDAHLIRARRDVTTLFTRAGLDVRPEAGSRETLARAIGGLYRLGLALSLDDLELYVDAMRTVAETELSRDEAQTLLQQDKEGALEIAVLASVLYEPILVGLRRAFHEHFSTLLLRPNKKKKTATASSRARKRTGKR